MSLRKNQTIIIQFNECELDVLCPRCNMISFPDRDYHTMPMIHCPNCNMHSILDISNSDLIVPEWHYRVPKKDYDRLLKPYFDEYPINFNPKLEKRRQETLDCIKRYTDEIDIFIANMLFITRVIPENLVNYYSEIELSQKQVAVLCKLSRYCSHPWDICGKDIPNIERDFRDAKHAETNRVPIENYQMVPEDEIKVEGVDEDGNIKISGFFEWYNRSTRPHTQEEIDALRAYKLFREDVVLTEEEKELFEQFKDKIGYDEELFETSRGCGKRFGIDTPQHIIDKYFNVSVRCDSYDILQPSVSYPEFAIVGCPSGIIVAEFQRFARSNRTKGICYYHCEAEYECTEKSSDEE